MPNVSSRAKEVPMSPFRKLALLAEQVKKRGVKVFHLNIGQPDILTPAGAIAKLQQKPLDIIGYGPADGLESTRAAMALFYQSKGISVTADDVLITSGASEAVQLVLFSCFEQGDEVIIPEPFYANYNGFAHIAGVRVVPVVSTIETGFALPEVSAFEALIGPKTKGIMLCNPNNPTGTFYSREVLEALGNLAIRYGLFLIIDEVYRDFCYDGDSFFSVLELPDMDAHAVLIDSVSKRFSACGVRIGTIVTRNAELREDIGRFTKLRLSPPVLGQMLTEYMLEEMETYLKPVVEEYAARRETLFNRLSAIPGVTTYKPGGAFYCFARLPVEDADDFCQWLLESFTYNDSTVMLSTGNAFYATPGLGKDEVRIAYILNRTDLNAAMDVLEHALQVYPGRKVVG